MVSYYRIGWVFLRASRMVFDIRRDGCVSRLLDFRSFMEWGRMSIQSYRVVFDPLLTFQYAMGAEVRGQEHIRSHDLRQKRIARAHLQPLKSVSHRSTRDKPKALLIGRSVNPSEGMVLVTASI